MRFIAWVFGILSLPLLLAGGFLMLNERGGTTAGAVHPVLTNEGVPLIDKNVPAVIETATFAVG